MFPSPHCYSSFHRHSLDHHHHNDDDNDDHTLYDTDTDTDTGNCGIPHNLLPHHALSTSGSPPPRRRLMATI